MNFKHTKRIDAVRWGYQNEGFHVLSEMLPKVVKAGTVMLPQALI
jgi:hypothetical protein